MQIDDEIPLLLMSIYLFRYTGACSNTLVSGIKLTRFLSGFSNLRERQSQVGSLAGAAHLLNDNTGVLRGAQ